MCEYEEVSRDHRGGPWQGGVALECREKGPTVLGEEVQDSGLRLRVVYKPGGGGKRYRCILQLLLHTIVWAEGTLYPCNQPLLPRFDELHG